MITNSTVSDLQDICTPGLAVPTIKSSVEFTQAAILRSAKGFKDDLSTAVTGNIAAITDQISLLSLRLPTSLKIPSLNLPSFTLGGSLSNIARAAQQVITAEIQGVARAAVAQAAQAIAGGVQGAFNELSRASVAQLQRNIEPVFKALRTIDGAIGRVEAQKALASAVFKSLDCPAKAEILSEVFFNAR